MDIDDRPDPLAALIPEPFVVPKYGGLSVGNVPATAGALLGADVGPLPALEPRLWQSLESGGVDRLLLLLVDAVGWERLQRVHDSDWRALLGSADGVFEPITSIFPSTTSATLTTLWTGAPPAVHGIAGYTMWVRELGVAVNTITFKPANKWLRGDLLEAFGGRVTTKTRTLPEQLAGHGIESHLVLPASVLKSGLTAIQAQGATSVLGYVGLADCMTAVRDLLNGLARRRAFVGVYWPIFDDLSHLRGPDPHHWDAEWRALTWAVGTELVPRLDSAARQRTVAAITADHGQHALDKERFVSLSDHPLLADSLVAPPTGDARAPYLHVSDGLRERARQYIEDHLGEHFAVLDSEEALAAGLWGPGEPRPEVRSRFGDLVLLGREGAALLPPSGEMKMRGSHGSLLREEAIVPWLAWRLGD